MNPWHAFFIGTVVGPVAIVVLMFCVLWMIPEDKD